MTVWRMVRRLSDKVKVSLDNNQVDEASHIEQFAFKDLRIETNMDERVIAVVDNEQEEVFTFDELSVRPSRVFKYLVGRMV